MAGNQIVVKTALPAFVSGVRTGRANADLKYRNTLIIGHPLRLYHREAPWLGAKDTTEQW